MSYDPFKPVEDADVEQRIRDNIEARTATDAKEAINAGIEQKKADIRDNKEGGFWGFLKSLFFKIAEFFGFEGTLAKWFGMPIPKEGEVKAVSQQVGETVSRALSDEDFTYGSKQEFEARMARRIKEDLIANRSDYPSLNDDQLNLITREAAKNTTAEFSELFDQNGNAIGNNPGLAPVTALATQKVSDALKAIPDDKKLAIAALGGKENFSDEDAKVFATALGSKMADLGTRKEALAAQGTTAFTAVSGEIRETLLANKDFINGNTGMRLSDAGLTAIADGIAEKFVKDEIGLADAPEAFSAGVTANRKAAVKETAMAQLEARLDKITPDALAEKIDAGIKGEIDRKYSTDPDKHDNKLRAFGYEVPIPTFVGGAFVPYIKSGVSYLITDDTATFVGQAPDSEDRQKLAQFMSGNAKTVAREEIAAAFERGDGTLDRERIIARLEKKIDAGIADGSIPESWADHKDGVKQSMRKQVNVALDESAPQLNQALATAAGLPLSVRELADSAGAGARDAGTADGQHLDKEAEAASKTSGSWFPSMPSIVWKRWV